FTPASPGSNRGIALRVPYYLVPRADSNVTTTLSLRKRATLGMANVQNRHSLVPGTAEFFAWGLEGKKNGLGPVDLRAAGVESFDAGGGDIVIAFAVNTHRGWATPAQQEFDILIDSNRDGKPDFLVFNTDLNFLLPGGVKVNGFTGQQVAFIVNLATG